MATQFHYDGVTVNLDDQWSFEWYRSKLDSYLASGGLEDARGWGWFWIDQASNQVFHFRLGESIAYGFTQVGDDRPGAIQDLSRVN